MPLCLPMVRQGVGRPTRWGLGLRWSATQRLQVSCGGCMLRVCGVHRCTVCVYIHVHTYVHVCMYTSYSLLLYVLNLFVCMYVHVCMLSVHRLTLHVPTCAIGHELHVWAIHVHCTYVCMYICACV